MNKLNLTINEVQELLRSAIERPVDERLKLLTAEGAEIEVELKNLESGRHTKGNASLESWLKKDGEIVVTIKRPKRNLGRPPKAPDTRFPVSLGGGGHALSVDEEIVQALKLYQERNKLSFVGLRKFKRDLPLYGVDMPEHELDVIIRQMVAQGKLVLDKLVNPFDPERPPTTTVRTPDMPEAENWFDPSKNRD